MYIIIVIQGGVIKMKEIVITSNEAGQRFDRFLRKYLKNMQLGAIYRAIRKKQITVNGNKSSEKYILNNGDIVKFNIDIEESKKEKDKSFLNIDYDIKTAYEDANIIAVEKRVNQIVHPDEGGDLSLTDEVMAYLYDRGEYDPDSEKTFAPSPCNRLDRNTSGLVLYAKNYETLKDINEMIREGNIRKYYFTIVKGKIKSDIYRAYMIKNKNTNRVGVSDTYKKDSKEIITGVDCVESNGQFSELDVDLETGRSHQIRAHLSWLGNPIIGDPKYGDKKLNNFFKDRYGLESQILIAYKLIFKNCPESLNYLEGKIVTMPIPSLYKKIRNDIFKF